MTAKKLLLAKSKRKVSFDAMPSGKEDLKVEDTSAKAVIDHNDDQPTEEGSKKDVMKNDESKTNQTSIAKQLKRKTRNNLRSRNMGLGLVIPKSPQAEDNTKTRQHKIFGDDDDDDDDEEPLEEDTKRTANGRETEEGDDSDDEIEEVKSSVAREQALKQRAVERKTASLVKLQSKTKKRKKKSDNLQKIDDSNIGDEEEFDEDFFEQLDSTRQSKKVKTSSQPQGRHTTFVSEENDTWDAPIQADHNIELVVLEDNDNNEEAMVNKLGMNMGTPPSELAQIFSKNKLIDGDKKKQPKKTSRTKNRTNKKAEKKDERGWKRSKKMNRLAATRLRAHRRTGHGVAAAHFVVQR